MQLIRKPVCSQFAAGMQLIRNLFGAGTQACSQPVCSRLCRPVRSLFVDCSQPVRSRYAGMSATGQQTCSHQVSKSKKGHL
ncbi:hypothetical protein HanPI659440_Chr00c09g0720731 [Helianthus annuus]|nr:hypothetical protein HanPI659440_Chr00c09g0720731 [Helianthus annuus]